MSLTDPFLPDSPELITGTHSQLVTVVATHPSWPAPIPLEAAEGTLSWDEQRAPRARLLLTCKVPTDPDTLDQLDPRVGVRLQVSAGYARTDGTQDVHLVADLGLRNRRVTRPQNLLELEAAGDEALVIDASAVSTSVSAADEPTAITQLLRLGAPGAAVDVTVDGAAAAAVSPVTDLWSTLDDVADRIDADVYDTGLRRFQVTPRPAIAAASAASLKVGANGTIQESDTALSRDEWYNAVRLVYTWANAAGAEQTVVGTAQITSGPFATSGPAGVRRYAEDRNVPTSQAGATAAAAALLRRLVSRGRSFQLRAVSALWLRPGMTVTVQLPTGNQERHLVAAVSFDLAGGWMDVTTRLPDNLNTIGE